MFSTYTNVFLAANVLADLNNDLVKLKASCQIIDLFPGLHKGNGERSCTTSCSMMVPFPGSCKIKTALCLTSLWGYLIFYPCIRDPHACLISSFNTPLTIYISWPSTLTTALPPGSWRHYSSLSSPVRYSSNNISLYPAPACSWTNCRKVDWAHVGSAIVQPWLGKKKKEWLWHYWELWGRGLDLPDCAKGHYKSQRPTGSANAHWNMSERGPASAHFARTQRGVWMESDEKVSVTGPEIGGWPNPNLNMWQQSESGTDRKPRARF